MAFVIRIILKGLAAVLQGLDACHEPDLKRMSPKSITVKLFCLKSRIAFGIIVLHEENAPGNIVPIQLPV